MPGNESMSNDASAPLDASAPGDGFMPKDKPTRQSPAGDMAQAEASRHRPDDLIAFAGALLRGAGLEAEMAADVAAVLVEGDLLGDAAHGLRLLAPYLAQIESGRMARGGAPRVFNASTASALWDGQRLPGPWLVRRAIGWAAPRAVQHGCASVVVRRSHHVGCLAAYLEPIARSGLLIQLNCADPGALDAASPGSGLRPAAASDAIAVGIPTAGDPILIAAATPATVQAGSPDGALALVVQALTAGLSGQDPGDPAQGWEATVSVQIHDPAAFGGLAAFHGAIGRATAAPWSGWPRDATGQVRLPGRRELARKHARLARGLALHADVRQALAPWMQRLGVALPTAA